MTSEEIKNNPLEITEETHIRTVELEEILGVKSSTYYKDIQFLEIQLYKDSDNRGWIIKDDLQRLKLLREHVRRKGRRTGFQELREGELITVEKNKLSNSNNNGNGKISKKKNIYVEPEDPRDNMDLEEIVRQGAELKAREIAMPHLVVRAIADKIEEHELPQDLQDNIEDAREVSNPKFMPSDVADSILTSYRKSLV